MDDRRKKTDLLNHLLEFISENKKMKFDQVIQFRTRYLTIVLEDIFQPHNASAVLRSCDCFGIQDVHIIENSNKYQINPKVALGSSQWLNLFRYNSAEHNTRACLQHLKNTGYSIVAASPHEQGYTIDNLPLDQKTAIIFGTEMQGLTNEALVMSDDFVKISMYGFTESFNISVSVALCLYRLSEKLRSSEISWQLNPEDAIDVKLRWAKQVVKNAELIEKRFFGKQ
jgi:tRNA (guanosine-2'-O-)-methyltransferase